MTLILLNQSPPLMFFTEPFENVRFVIKFSPSEGMFVILLTPLFIIVFISGIGTEIFGALIFILSDITLNNSAMFGSFSLSSTSVYV
ncbi:hypothetical protein D3C79_748680 [compost metagenome]